MMCAMIYMGVAFCMVLADGDREIPMWKIAIWPIAVAIEIVRRIKEARRG